MNILIFDFEETGHHFEFIEHMIDFISNNNSNPDKYIFVLHPQLSDKLNKIVKNSNNEKINIFPISILELKELFSYNENIAQYKLKPNKVYKLLTNYAERFNADKCVLMYFNYFIYPLILNRPKFEIYGIYFSPFIRKNSNLNLTDKLKILKSKILTVLYTRNKKIKKIFILNDHSAVNALNKLVRKRIFYYLPDPAPVINEEKNYNIRSIFNIHNSKKILLHFGSLRESKGTIELLQSLNLLSKDVSSKCCIIIAGKPKNRIIEEKINQILERTTNVQIIRIEKFLSNNKLKSFINQSDIIIMPYKNSEASSGVLGHAIIAEKPVITTQSGLIGEIVKNTWKGELLKKISPEEIAEAIERSITKEYVQIDNTFYIREHSPYNFARELLNK